MYRKQQQQKTNITEDSIIKSQDGNKAHSWPGAIPSLLFSVSQQLNLEDCFCSVYGQSFVPMSSPFPKHEMDFAVPLKQNLSCTFKAMQEHESFPHDSNVGRMPWWNAP